MKRKIFTLLMVMLCLVGITKAQSITLELSWWEKVWKWCLIPVDVYVDTEWVRIDTTSIFVKSNLKFVDYVSTWIFPHVLKVLDSDDMIWFVSSVDLTKWSFDWNSKIWTLYYLADWDEWNLYWIELLYDWWDTTSALFKWGVNYLKWPSWVGVIISSDMDECVNENQVIDWWYWDLTYDEAVDLMITSMTEEQNVIQKNYRLNKILSLLKIYWPIVLIIIALAFVLLYYKKRSKWKNY